MEEHSCAKFGRCNNPFHDHDTYAREALPEGAALVNTEDPAFEAITRLLMDLRDAGVDLTPETVRTAVTLGRHYHQRATGSLPIMPKQRANELDKALVYYVRKGNMIKIGTTRDMRQRMRYLKPDEILAVEPGSFALEKQRHQQFARFHSHGEYFLPARPLIDHISAIRRRHGKPPKKRPNLQRARSVLAESPTTLF